MSDATRTARERVLQAVARWNTAYQRWLGPSSSLPHHITVNDDFMDGCNALTEAWDAYIATMHRGGLHDAPPTQG